MIIFELLFNTFEASTILRHLEQWQWQNSKSNSVIFSLTSRSFVMFEPEQRPDEQRAQVELNQQRRGQRHQERRLRAVPQGQHQRDSTEMRHS